MFFDTHAHFGEDAAQVDAQVQRADAAGVKGLVAVGGSRAANRAARAVAGRFPHRVWAAIGFDRDQAAALADEQTDALQARLFPAGFDRSRIVALGEIGLDFHYAAETEASQTALFRRQLALARQRQLPVVVHSREAESATRAELERHARLWDGDRERLGVLHCFTGSRALADALLEMGYYLSVSGIATFPGADDARAIARRIPESRLLIETDAPYLAPVPMRGRKNEPAYIRHTAETLANVRGVPLHELARTTFRNACRLFSVPQEDHTMPNLIYS